MTSPNSDRRKYLEFEQPILELEERVAALRESAREGGNAALLHEVDEVQAKLEAALRELSSRLTPWQRTLLARHPLRPGAGDLAARFASDLLVLHGDRAFADDPALIVTLARFREREALVVRHEKGREPSERVKANFGMANPEGYRKVMRAARIAERFHRSVILLIDTPGAYPGIGAEERGQAWAIAESIEFFMNLRTPTVAVVVGEGGSGGALALGIADRVLMMENAVYSVISPEGCASILFRDATRAPEAAAALKITAADAMRLGIIDGVVEEPSGGAHRDWDEAGRFLGDALEKALVEIEDVKPEKLVARRHERFRRIGAYIEN